MLYVKDMIQEKTDAELKAWILYKLAKHGYFGGRHTDFENIVKGFKPQHLGKKGQRRVDELATDMIREGLLVRKPTSYGLHVRLNSAMSAEIKKRIKDALDIDLS